MEFATSADGTTIGFKRTGAGPPLLLVHGTTADHTRWAGVSSRFEKHFTVYAMDRRGRGSSSDGPAYDILREAEDVVAVVTVVTALAATKEPVSILAHSYGAVCCLEAALLTDTVGKLVLYEPPIPTGILMYPDGVPDQMQSLLDEGNQEAALELFMRDVVRMPEHELDAYRALPMWDARIQLAATIPRELAIDRSYRFESDKFANLSLPVLLLTGSDSPPMFGRALQALGAALPNSRVVAMAGQQHIAMDTDPDQFTNTVLRFLLA